MKLSSIIYLLIFILSVDVIYGQKSVAKLSQQETGKDGYADTQVNNITLPTQQKIEEWLHEYKVPAVGIGIIENNKLVHVKVVGKLETNRSAPDNTVFNVASLTKPVVTMLTLKLVEAGKLDLDEPLSNYWIDPDIKHDPMHKLLTARIILSHQTGFANWRGDKKLSFQFKPGSKYQYSGEGFEYLRKAIEQKLGKSLEVLSQMYIFNPLQMKDTRYVWDTSVEPRFATWHDKQGKTYKTWKRTEANAADDLLTTIEDYGKFGVDVLKEAGLSQALFNKMISPQVAVSKHVDYGLGWLVVKDLLQNEYALVHSGADMGIRAIIILLPNSKRGIILMTNGDNGHKVMQQIGNESLDIGKQLISYLN